MAHSCPVWQKATAAQRELQAHYQLSIEEISKALHASESAVKSRLLIARKKAAILFEKEYGYGPENIRLD